MSEILIVKSSFRKKSNSNLLAERVAEGARERGHQVQEIDISRLQIGPCRGCEGCLQPGSNFCVNKDDMHRFYPAVQAAEALIFASPVYWFNLCGQIKQFIDRCFAVAVSPDGGVSPFAGKKIGAVLTYGDDDPFDSGCVNALRSLQDICAFTGAKWMPAVYGSAYKEGEIARNMALLEKARKYGASF